LHYPHGSGWPAWFLDNAMDDDLAVANRCHQFDSLLQKALGLADGSDEEQFSWFFGSAKHIATQLQVEAANRGLDAWPLHVLTASEFLPETPKAREELLCGAASSVGLLLKVVQSKSVPAKRRLVGLIHRFLYDVSRYLSLANLLTTHERLVEKTRRSLRQMAQEAEMRPSEEQIREIVALDDKKNQSRANVILSGSELASELVRSEVNAKGVLQIVHRADAAGGPNAVLSVWEEVKVELQQVLITLALEEQDRASQDQTQAPVADANTAKLFPRGVPPNPDIVDLVVRLDAAKGSGKSDIQIAREFKGETAGNDPKSKSLLSQIRRMRRNGRITL
jgi:hypothetical protein